MTTSVTAPPHTTSIAPGAAWPILLALAGAASGCNSAGAPPARLAETQTMTEFRGTLTVPGSGPFEAEVFLLHADGKVAAATRVQPSGGYAIAPPAGYAGGLLLAKLYRPVVGARAVSVGARPDRVIDVAIGAGEAIALDGSIVMPDHVAMEWLDVHLTPRTLDGLAPEAAGALLAVGPEPVRRSTYVTTRITAPSFAFRVLPGVYRLEVERVFPDSGGMASPPVNVQLGSVTVASGPPAEPAPIGAWVTVRQPVSVRVQMAVVAPERL